MWAPTSVVSSSKIVGRMLWPLSRSSVRSQGSQVVPRSFGTTSSLGASDCGGTRSCSRPPGTVACVEKRKPCKRRYCPTPCHACPQEDPCWHCPYVPPPCPKRRPCCPICPTANPYEYKSTCCPPLDECRKKCAPCDPPPPPPRRLTRCERPGAMDDPCCQRHPRCPDPCDKDPQKDSPCFNDCPERPRPPDPCKIEGEICSEEPCEFKRPENCCSEAPDRDVKCCPRKQKSVKKKKRVIKKACCLDLDPNWPPKRRYCECESPPKDPNVPCQQAQLPKKEFWDGLC